MRLIISTILPVVRSSASLLSMIDRSIRVDKRLDDNINVFKPVYPSK